MATIRQKPSSVSEATKLNNNSLWEDNTGAQVEYYVKEQLDTLENSIESTNTSISKLKGNIPSSAEYSTESSTLTFKNEDGDTLFDTIVAVANVEMSYTLHVGDLYYNDDKVSSGQEFAYQSSDKYELEVAVTKTSQSTLSSTRNDIKGAINVQVTFGNVTETYKVNPISYEYVDEITGIPTAEIVIPRITLSEALLKQNNTGTLTVTYVASNTETLTRESEVSITTAVPEISYVGSYIITSPIVDFKVTGLSGYAFYGFNNNTRIDGVNSSSSIPITSGVNKLCIYAQSTKNNSIKTDYIYVDVIYTEDVTETIAVINEVSTTLDNNGISSLFRIDAYSPNKKDLVYSAYLDDSIDEKENNVETITISEENYTSLGTDTKAGTYTKELSTYIETNAAETKYLKVYINDTQYTNPQIYQDTQGKNQVAFANYWPITISAPDSTILPYSDNTPSLQWTQADHGGTNTTFTGLNALNVQDGQITDEGLTAFKVSARSTPLYSTGYKNLNLGSNFTIEFGIKTYNISDENQPIITLGDLVIKATDIGWNIDDIKSAAYLNSNAQFQENTITHITITCNPTYTLTTSDAYYPDYLTSDYQEKFNDYDNKTYSLVKIYINGIVYREMNLGTYSISSQMNICPKAADVNFYLIRVYNNIALTSDQVQQNYISFIPKTVDKKKAYARNNILTNGVVSYTKANKLYNCLIYVMPSGYTVLNRAYENKKSDAMVKLKTLSSTMFIHYADEVVNNSFGGKLTHVSLSPQGSSAMTYGQWNVQGKMGEFSEDAEWNTTTIYETLAEAQAACISGGVPKEAVYKYYAQIVLAVKAAEATETTPAVEAVEAEYGEIAYDTLKEAQENSIENGVPKAEACGWYAQTVLEGIDSYWITPSGEEYKNYVLLPNVNADQTLASGAPTDGLKIKKFVGKVNWASSMQSHKPGACDLFNDSFTGTNRTSGRKAVKELPYLYFYVNYDDLKTTKDISDLTIEDVQDKAKFAGIQTWGSAKCDKASFGYDKKKTPEYLLLEGAENSSVATAFMVPWQAMQHFTKSGSDYISYTDPQINYTSTTTTIGSEDAPWKNLKISGESIYYLENEACWDIDFGCNDDENGFTDKVKNSVKKFREFYDFVYTYDLDIQFVDNFTNQARWNQKKKYCVTSSSASSSTLVGTHNAYDIYRYDSLASMWVRAGVTYESNNNGWQRLNALTLAGLTSASTLDIIKQNIKNTFYTNLSKYVDITDLAHHQACIKILSGTDNRNKNTYLRIIGPIYEEDPETGKYVATDDDYRVTFMQDDLDTIFVTDNQGKQSKPYNLIEASYDNEWDMTIGESGAYATTTPSYWGDNDKNVLFRSFDRAFEAEIKTQLAKVLKSHLNATKITNTSTKFYKAFFAIQEYFPEVVWNHTAHLNYEVWQFIKNSSIIGTYTNNNEAPLVQSHGNQLESEKQFMQKRLEFLQSYALTLAGVDYIELNTNKTNGNSTNIYFDITYTPFRDFYPNYTFGGSESGDNSTNLYLNPTVDPGTYDIIDYRAVVGTTYIASTDSGKSGTMHGIPQTWLYKTAEISKFQGQDFGGDWGHLTDLVINNNENYPTNLGTISASLPVLENLTINNVQIPSALDFSGSYKLKTLDLSTCTGLSSISLPRTSTLTSVKLPSTLTSLNLTNVTNLTEVEIDNWNSISQLTIKNAPKLDVNALLENLPESSVVRLTLDQDIYVTTDVVEFLLTLNEDDLELNDHTVYIVDEAGSTTLKEISYALALKLYRNAKFKYLFEEVAITKSNCTFASVATTTTQLDLYSLLQVSSGNVVPGTITFTKSGGGSLRNGILTKTSNTASAIITVSIGGSKYSNTITVEFSKHEPEVGDFAYSDGTFNSIYDSTRTVVGLVFAIDGTKVYIIGSEVVKSGTQTAFMGGFDSTGGPTSMQNLITDITGGTYGSTVLARYNAIKSVATDVNVVQMSVTEFNAGNVSTSYYKGKENTDLLYEAATQGDITDITDSRIQNTAISKDLVYLPYYTATHLYEPSASDLNDQYKATNWYVPNKFEWSQILRQRACSATTSSFDSTNLSDSILSTASTYNNVVPIFAYALKRGYQNSIYDNLSSYISNTTMQLTSSLTSNPMNSYIYYMQYNGSSSENTPVLSSAYYNSNTWYNATQGWSGYPHISIPFVIFDTSLEEE